MLEKFFFKYQSILIGLKYIFRGSKNLFFYYYKMFALCYLFLKISPKQLKKKIFIFIKALSYALIYIK